MQAVIKDLTELSTSVAIASSIWLLRKKNRWNRLRLAWAQRRQPDPAPAALAPPAPTQPMPLGPLPVGHAVRAQAHRASAPPRAALDHVDVVEDSDWQLWEAAVASQNSRAGGRAR